LEQDFDYFCELTGATRPTAVNLFWAIERMRERFRRAKAGGADAEAIKRQLIEEAQKIFDDDIESNRALGRFGGELIADNSTVLTHCNAGALATAGDYGTALGVVRGARDAGKRVVVGADRIAANGDAANKIGTYMVAVLANRHSIPFYVAAPVSTVDLSTPTGEQIPIEERDTREVTHVREHRLSPEGVTVQNPAFDVTPNELIAAIITDRGVARPPYTESLRVFLSLNEKSTGCL
jgi:methylthioribose-1-phosphate isomerase